jgi:hypothetical protein
MYCVIQKIQNKKPNGYGERKEIKISSTTWSMGDEPPKTKYYYTYSDERFERPILDAYKISIHESYRDNGKVKKKQWVICTMGYYDFIDSWVGDHVVEGILEEKLDEMGIGKHELWDMVYGKLTPIEENILKEFEKTEESKAKKEHEKILKEHQRVKEAFEKKYGQDTYDYCYDVLGTLRNKEYLKQVKGDYESQQQYKSSSYYDSGSNNYSDYDFSSYFKKQHSTYNEEEKENLKKIYKALALKFHPDMTKDDGTMMKLVNKLKGEWGI